MPLRAIIFDLDDTLYDCTNTLTQAATDRAIVAMIEHGLQASKQEAKHFLNEYQANATHRVHALDALVDHFGPQRETILEHGMIAYNAPTIDQPIELFPGVLETLSELRHHYKLILVTTGLRERQRNKLRLLGLTDAFDCILIDDIHEGLSKRERFLAAATNFNVTCEDMAVVGDRIFSEIKIGNQLGMTTIRMHHGAYANIHPSKEWEAPDHNIRAITELPELIHRIDQHTPKRIVVIGGGTGVPALLQGLRGHPTKLTGIIAVTDAGRSSGRLRKLFDMAPPGDIRNCLAALATGDDTLTELLQYRFDRGDLTGHTIGNLLIAALTQMTGSFNKAIDELARLLQIDGTVLPSSPANVHIRAQLADGSWLENECDIVETDNTHVHERSPIQHVELSEKAPASPAVLSAIKEADAIVLGPGGLYTSILSNLLVDGVKEALCESNARLFYVCNLVTQPCQTHNHSVSDHVDAIERYLKPGIIDHVLVHDKDLPKTLLDILKEGHAYPVEEDEQTKTMPLVKANLIKEQDSIDELWEKQNLLQHDPKKLADVIMDVLSEE